MSEWPCVDCKGTGINRSSKTCPCCHGLGYHGGGQDCNNEQERTMEPPTKGCSKHTCTDHERCRAVTAACGCEECALAIEMLQRARERSPIDPNQSDEAKRAAFADRFRRETKALAEANRRQDAIAATGLYCPTEAEIAQGYATVSEVTPLPPPMCGEEFTPRGSDYMIRVVCERERGHDGYHGTVPVTEGGTAIGAPATGSRVPAGQCGECGGGDDPNTAALEAQIAERNRMRAEIADLQRSLDLVHDSDRRGIEMWRAEHPSRALLIPDRATMISWLIEENVKMRDGRAMEHRTHATAETLLATGQRAGKEEIARLRRQVDELTRQRDEADRKLAANAARLDTFMRGVAHLSIERMRLEREREERPHIYTPNRNIELQAQLAAAEQESARRRLRFDECEAACWEAIEAARDAGVGFWSERNVDVEHAVTLTIDGLAKLLADMREQLRVADVERVTFGIERDAAIAEQKRAAPVLEAALAMDDDTTPGLNDDAVERIHRGRADRLRDAVKAYRDSADPGSDGMPF